MAPISSNYRINKLITHKRWICGFILWLLMSNASIAQQNLEFTVSSFLIEGDNPISQSDSLKIVQEFTGKQSGFEGLNTAREALEQELARQGFPFYRVTLPPQELLDGAVTFKIVKFRLGKVIVEGNEYFSTQNIRNSVPQLLEDVSPNTQKISRSLSIANGNPAKSISLSFKGSEQSEHIDAVLKVKEQNPQLYYIQLNNSGTEDGAESRVSLGYQHNALWNRDHGLTLSYTTSPEDTAALSQWGLTYRMPMYEHGATLSFLVSDSEIDSGVVADDFEISGSGSVFSVDYKRPLARSGNFSHSINIGIASKSFDNNVSFLGAQIGNDIVTQPLTLGYKGAWLKPTGQWSFSIDTAANISGGSGNEDEDYEKLVAEADWLAIHYGVNYIHRFSNHSLFNFSLSGQQSSDLLVSGEQFGIGGASSVRGYDERGVAGDEGYDISLEYWLKPLTSYDIRLLVFYDAGTVTINEPQLGEQRSQSISSSGIGLRYNWKQTISINLDLAVAMDDSGVTQDGDSKAHISVLVRF